MRHIVDGVAHHLAKDGVLLVQVWARFQGDEELAAVGVRLILIRTGDNAPADPSNKAHARKQSRKEDSVFVIVSAPM